MALEYTLPSGGRYRDEQLHLWTFGGDGKIVAIRHFLDTAKLLGATPGRGHDDGWVVKTRPWPRPGRDRPGPRGAPVTA